ncbi:helix-turn-helix domain-containing protein [Roseinatronobacter sp. S2]|uniref:winged helix-turn-helix transcriptional regulator n=1 Tax=Roseinatronobacter sp. S2 TaxID=3035471 RepID=UPI00240EB3C0|nr:helix-turn-helix domain-containing protein [Roseinatronobacter sp. S2]WFE74712.1 helix-turn-helix domain-containing protein [Roseinatronobacter sp. S2]
MKGHETQRITTIQTGSTTEGIPRTARRPADCLAEDWLAFLGHRWNALILWHLSGGPMRYGSLQNMLPGITPKVLSERLNGLTRRALIARRVHNSFPREVTYGLTPQGAALGSIIRQLYTWANDNSAQPAGHPSLLAHGDDTQ